MLDAYFLKKKKPNSFQSILHGFQVRLIFFKKFGGHIPFCGDTDTRVLDFWCTCPEFQNQGQSLLACFLTNGDPRSHL